MGADLFFSVFIVFGGLKLNTPRDFVIKFTKEQVHCAFKPAGGCCLLWHRSLRPAEFRAAVLNQCLIEPQGFGESVFSCSWESPPQGSGDSLFQFVMACPIFYFSIKKGSVNAHLKLVRFGTTQVKNRWFRAQTVEAVQNETREKFLFGKHSEERCILKISALFT